MDVNHCDDRSTFAGPAGSNCGLNQRRLSGGPIALGVATRMPITFNYDPALRILFTKAEGGITLTELQRHLDTETEEKALAHRELIDASAAWTDFNSEQVRVVVQRLRRMLQEHQFGPTAVVTTNDELFGMSSMLAILSEVQGGPSIGVFRGFSEALDWLLRVPPAG